MMDSLAVRRSGLRVWLIALAGVPLITIGLDILMRRRIFAAISSVVFTGDPQLVEPRDVIWAVVLLLLGLVFVGYGITALLNPTPAVLADLNGLHLHLGHPLSRLVTVPWDEVDDVGAENLDDDGSVVPVMWVRVVNPEVLPENPWGARWIEPDTVAIMAADWERPPRSVAVAIAEIALQVPVTEPVPADEGIVVGGESER